MKRIISYTCIVLLLLATIPSMMHIVHFGTENTDTIGLPANALEILNQQMNPDMDFGMMLFSPAVHNDQGIYYTCRRGVTTIAYFGASEVFYNLDGTCMKLEFPGSNLVVPVVENPTGSKTNYLLGNDQDKWQTGLQDFAALRYPDIYEGIDLIYRCSEGALKYEFEVAPFADPTLIQCRYPDSSSIVLLSEMVTVSQNENQICDTDLYVYQEDENLQSVYCEFSRVDEKTIGFTLGEYSPSMKLIIDPVIGFSTYLGGEGVDAGFGVTEEDDYFYVTGVTEGLGFPLVNPYNSTHGGDGDCFVTKFDVFTNVLIYSTFIGGRFFDKGKAIDVENGFMYITGICQSLDFPVVNGYEFTDPNPTDPDIPPYGAPFIVKLSPDGQSLLFSTSLIDTDGYQTASQGMDIYVENSIVYVVGFGDGIRSTNFMDTFNGEEDCFWVRLNSSLPWPFHPASYTGAYLGGSAIDRGMGIVVKDGIIYVTGYTFSSDFNTVNPYDSTLNGTTDAFLAWYSATDIHPPAIYSTLIGGSLDEEARSIVAEDGNLIIAGETTSSDYPIYNAYDSTYNGAGDIFLTKFASDGQSLIFSTFFGGTLSESIESMVVGNGVITATGFTSSSDFPTADGIDESYNGGTDCFLIRLDSSGQSLEYGTFIGGSSDDSGADIAVASESGYIFITGYTDSSDYPIVDASDSILNGSMDCFITVLFEDQDFDGLSDCLEEVYGTNPFCIDSDNDNFLDAYEVRYGSNPLDPESYPAMPQVWFDAIYADLDGNSTLIQYLIDWSDGNSSLIESIMLQLDANTTLLTRVISWLDGNHTAIEILFTHLEGNATLLRQTMDELDANTTLIEELNNWFSEIDSLVDILYANLDGNATLLLDIMSTVNDNSAELDLLSALIAQDITALTTFNASYIEDMDEIRDILDQLGVSVGDSDYDGLDDLDEIYYGTDLLCIDTDQDNLLDSFEVKLGTDPLVDDSDSDTYLDGIEVIAGSDPLDPLSYPGSTGMNDTILVIAIVAGAGVAVVVAILVIKKVRFKT